MSIFDQSRQAFANLSKPTGRPPLEGAYVYILAVLVGYMVADLTVLSFRDDMLPTQAPPARPIPSTSAGNQFADSMVIKDRNIFNPDGVIPPALQPENQEGDDMLDGPAVPSQLPLSLEGTLVHMNPKRSVATINLKSKNMTQAFSVDDEIEGLAQITKIERRKVTFVNTRNRRLEYIEIPEDALLNFGMKQEKSGDKGEVSKMGEFDFQVNRNDIKKYTSDLSSILNQARMVPNIVPGSGGGVEGFRFVSIQPGSIYEKLGFKPMDVIKSVNGEPV
ncbi:MAG: general secretion pathway protein GspC, partial [Bdellovibrionales bacterium]|nr:general secretion pathway protein GspC [Bdellovibrionales bacterium]